MRSFGANVIIAVDVAAEDDTTPATYGDSLSGWWVLFNQFNPFRGKGKIPTLADIQSRLAYVSSVKELEDAKNQKKVLYVKMPVQQFGTLQFSKFDEIRRVGYEFAREKLKEWRQDGVFDKIGLPYTKRHKQTHRERFAARHRGLRRNADGHLGSTRSHQPHPAAISRRQPTYHSSFYQVHDAAPVEARDKTKNTVLAKGSGTPKMRAATFELRETSSVKEPQATALSQAYSPEPSDKSSQPNLVDDEDDFEGTGDYTRRRRHSI